MKTILVTGGAGYIGSHTCIELMKSGYEVVIIDDLSNSKSIAVERIEKISGKKVQFYKESILNREALDRIFKEHNIDAVINFAGFTAVGESVAKPVEYYHNNIGGLIILLEAMRDAGC